MAVGKGGFGTPNGPGAADVYSIIFRVEGLGKLYTSTAALALDLQRKGYPTYAQLVNKALRSLEVDLRVVAHNISLAAQRAIVDAEESSRVRPDTHGEGGPRLQEYIGRSDPLPAVPGSVGINNEEFLANSPVHWWWTQEEGYTGHKGREVKGFFHDPGFTNMSAPSPFKSGQHPLFTPTGGSGRTMHIEEAIVERRFVLRGSSDVADDWHRGVRSARERFDREIRTIIGAFTKSEDDKRKRRRGRP
jgi:hypothetical protein